MHRKLKRAKILIENVLGIEIISSRTKKSIINEAVNFEKQAIFIAIPKTGTTSVNSQLKQIGNPIIPNHHLNIVQIRELIYIHLLKETLGTNMAYPNNNFPTDCLLRKKASELFNSFFKFSAVRNPWARAVSLYFRREGIILKDKMTFDEFIDCHFYASDTCNHPTLNKNQYDWLCDEKGKIIMDYVYKVEEFKNAINEIEKRTDGRVKLINVNRNYNPQSKSKDYRDLYSDFTRKIIQKRFEKDIDYFKYKF